MDMKLTTRKTKNNTQPFEAIIGNQVVRCYGERNTLHLPFLRLPIGYQTTNEDHIKPTYKKLFNTQKSALTEDIEPHFNMKLKNVEDMHFFSLIVENKKRPQAIQLNPSQFNELNDPLKLHVRLTFTLPYNYVLYTTANIVCEIMPTKQELDNITKNKLTNYLKLSPDDASYVRYDTKQFQQITKTDDPNILHVHALNTQNGCIFKQVVCSIDELNKNLTTIELLNIRPSRPEASDENTTL